jgi:hypothetical protein
VNAASAGRPSARVASAPQRSTLDSLLAAARFPGFAVGWGLAALVGVGLLALGSHRLVADVLDRPAGTCPLNGDRS